MADAALQVTTDNLLVSAEGVRPDLRSRHQLQPLVKEIRKGASRVTGAIVAGALSTTEPLGTSARVLGSHLDAVPC